MPNPNNAREDACKQELKRSNKYEEGACNIHKAHNAEKITLGGQKNEIFNEEQVYSSVKAEKQDFEAEIICVK